MAKTRGSGGKVTGPTGGERQLRVRVKTARGRKTSSTRWLDRQLNDPYVSAAQREGMRSRAAYKLAEIDDKYRFLKPGKCVVDLGAAPGGWSQIATQRVHAIDVTGDGSPHEERPQAKHETGSRNKRDTGQVIAIDYLSFDALPGVQFVKMDFTDEEAEPKLKSLLRDGRADIVLSDMAAPTVGHTRTDHLRIMGLAETAAWFALDVLAPGGVFLCKVFQGGTERELLDMLKKNFKTVRHVKPKASRKDSAELYVLATGFKAETD